MKNKSMKYFLVVEICPKKHNILGDFSFFPIRNITGTPKKFSRKIFVWEFFGNTRDQIEHIGE